MMITQIRFAAGGISGNAGRGKKYRQYTLIKSLKWVLPATILFGVCFAAPAQNSKYGLDNIHFNESKSRLLTDTEIQKLVAGLWAGLPDHGINDNTRQSLTDSFFAIVEESFIVPTDNPGGIGSDEDLWYWYCEGDFDESDHISRIETIQQTSAKITAKVTYTNLNTPTEHTMVLVKEDGKWKVDDFDSKRREMQDYINNARKAFSGGLHKQMMQEPEYAQHFSPADRQKYIAEVEYYLDQYVRKPQALIPRQSGQRPETQPQQQLPQTLTAPDTGYPRPNLAEILDKVVDQYPEDVRLFENPLVRDRLIALMGESRFNIMVQNFQYTYPIEKGRSKYLIMGCKRNKCGITDFEIQYNPNSNNLCVKYNVDGNTEVFMDEAVKVNWHEYIDE